MDQINNTYIENWVSQQVHLDNGETSWKVFTEILLKLPNHDITLGPKKNDENFHFTINGALVNGSFVIQKV